MKYVSYTFGAILAAIAFLHLPAGCHLATRYNERLERRIDKAFERGEFQPSITKIDELANDLERLTRAKESPWRRVEDKSHGR
jgi:hypothetical protein